MRTSIISLAAAAAVLAGCGGHTSPGGGGAGAAGSARYAVLGVVYGDDVTTSYISLLDTLDVQTIDYTRALELPGAVSMTSYGSWLFVGSADDLTITRYSTGGGTFTKDAVLNLSDRDIEDLEVDDFANTFAGAHKAYLVSSAGTTIVWDPTAMVVTGEIATPALVRPPPLDIDVGPGVLRGGRIYRVVTWRDFDQDTTSAEQYLTVLDTATDQMVAMTPETRCPGLTNRVTGDEAGNLYFSSWFNVASQALVLGTPKPCVLRLPAGAEVFDPGWKLAYADVAGGRDGAGLNYLKQGDAFMSVFYADQVAVDPTTTVSDVDDATNWQFWRVNLPTATAAPLPLPGMDWLSSRTFTATLDGRNFVIAPASTFDVTPVYEVTAAGAEKRFDVTGFSYQLVELR